MTTTAIRSLLGLSLATALAATAGLAQAQTVQARVLSATPIRDTTGTAPDYNVTYEYNGRRYTTRMDHQPGAFIQVQANGYGVTTSPVAPQSRLQPYPVEAGNGQNADGSPWDNVVPEPGEVVSGNQPVYAQPGYAPVYPAPVYVQPAYSYPYAAYPYASYPYSPVGISLNLGYSRGYYGGYRGGWGGYRGYGGYRGGWGGGYRGGWGGGYRGGWGGHGGWHR